MIWYNEYSSTQINPSSTEYGVVWFESWYDLILRFHHDHGLPRLPSLPSLPSSACRYRNKRKLGRRVWRYDVSLNYYEVRSMYEHSDYSVHNTDLSDRHTLDERGCCPHWGMAGAEHETKGDVPRYCMHIGYIGQDSQYHIRHDAHCLSTQPFHGDEVLHLVNIAGLSTRDHNIQII